MEPQHPANPPPQAPLPLIPLEGSRESPRVAHEWNRSVPHTGPLGGLHSALAALLAPGRMLLGPTGSAGHGRQPRQVQLSWHGKQGGTLPLTSLLHALLLLKGHQCKLFSERISHEDIPLTFAHRLVSPRT